MIDKFMSLEPEKRERIINAAIREFAQKGYKHASTNEIVKEANISKGLLFHYFKNKLSLYLFLFDYIVDLFETDFYGRLDYGETDVISRWQQIALLKIELIRRHPDLYDFLLASVSDESIELQQEVASRRQRVMEEALHKVMLNIDTSCFKAGLDIRRASEIIVWTAQGFSSSELEKIKHSPEYRASYDPEKVITEFNSYIELLRDAFYK